MWLQLTKLGYYSVFNLGQLQPTVRAELVEA